MEPKREPFLSHVVLAPQRARRKTGGLSEIRQRPKIAGRSSWDKLNIRSAKTLTEDDISWPRVAAKNGRQYGASANRVSVWKRASIGTISVPRSRCSPKDKRPWKRMQEAQRRVSRAVKPYFEWPNIFEALILTGCGLLVKSTFHAMVIDLGKLLECLSRPLQWGPVFAQFVHTQLCDAAFRMMEGCLKRLCARCFESSKSLGVA